jgi:hypothetical protein
MEDTPPLERRCPACGATMPQQARFCGACGMESQSAESRAESLNTAAPVAAAPSVAPHTPTDPPVVASGAAYVGADGRDCPWCGASNPPNAGQCVTCGAVFPTPEGDAALERAAQARIQAMEGELQPRCSGWWPFRGR